MSILRFKSDADVPAHIQARMRSAPPIKTHEPKPAPCVSGKIDRGTAQGIGSGIDETASKQGSGVVSDLEERLAMQLQAAGLPEPVREYRFAPPRRWRADFAWPNVALLVEVEGGHWNGGRHTRGAGFDRDVEKYNEAGLLAWRLVRVTGTHIKNGQAIEWIKRALAV